MNMNEKELERKLVAAVKAKGGLAYKFISPGRVGVPDRVIALPGGRVMFAEVKSPTGKGRLSERQKREIAALQALGVRVEVVDSMEGIAELLETEVMTKGEEA